MKISELIALAERVLSEHGDVEVLVTHRDGGYASDTIASVEKVIRLDPETMVPDSLDSHAVSALVII